MRWSKFARYRHNRCLDIDIIIMNLNFVSSVGVFAKVLFVNQKNPEFIYNVGDVKILRKEWKNWREIC